MKEHPFSPTAHLSPLFSNLFKGCCISLDIGLALHHFFFFSEMVLTLHVLFVFNTPRKEFHQKNFSVNE